MDLSLGLFVATKRSVELSPAKCLAAAMRALHQYNLAQYFKRTLIQIKENCFF
jgi:hypothetical protein